MKRSGDGTVSRLAIDEELAGGDVSPVAVVVGANASGKSTLLEAMTVARSIVRSSALREASRPWPYEGFLLGTDARDRPTSYEFWFTTAGEEYRYSFSIQDGLVASEKLTETAQGATRKTTKTLFDRTGDKIVASSALRGPKKKIIDATRKNSLFVSKAAQENFKALLDVYDWLVGPSTLDQRGDAGIAMLESEPGYRDWILNLLVQADIGVTDLSVEQRQPPHHLVAQYARSDDPDEMARAEQRLIRSWQRPQLLHHSEADDAPIPWNRESAGTQSLWELASDIYRALGTGSPLSVDELGSLHPLLIREILRSFQTKRINPRGAQLIFTSHDVTLLGNWGGDGYMIDRDQIVVAEKDYESGVTSFIRLADFRPRKDEDIEKWYLQGRYGGVPTIGELFDTE